MQARRPTLQTRQMPDSPLSKALSRLAEAETRVVNAEARATEAERRLADAGSRIMRLEGEVAALRRRPLDRILSWVRT